MNRQEWVWVAVKALGIYFIVLSLLYIPTMFYGFSTFFEREKVLWILISLGGLLIGLFAGLLLAFKTRQILGLVLTGEEVDDSDEDDDNENSEKTEIKELNAEKLVWIIAKCIGVYYLTTAFIKLPQAIHSLATYSQELELSHFITHLLPPFSYFAVGLLMTVFCSFFVKLFSRKLELQKLKEDLKYFKEIDEGKPE